MRSNPERNIRVVLAVALGLSGVFFAIDLMLPLGVAEGIMYVPIVLMTLWLPGVRYTLGFSLAASILVGIGFFWSSTGGSTVMTLTNRFLSVAGIWLAALVVILYKHNQQALRESEARNQLILDAAAEGIVSFNSDGRLESINRAAEQMFDYSADELLGRSVDLLFVGADELHLPWSSNGADVTTSEESVVKPQMKEMIGQRKDGTTFPIRIAISTVDLPSGTLFTAMVQDITARRRLERKLVGVPEEERQQIGYDLHEGVGQILNGIKLFAEHLLDHLQDRDPTAARLAGRIRDGLTEADEQIAELIYQLTPVSLVANDLVRALDQMSAAVTDTEDVRCEVRTTGEKAVRDNTVITHLYHIAREALSNAVQHGNPSRIVIRLHEGMDEIRLHVEDDGRGMDRDLESMEGMGLRVMEYRARIIGATLHVESSPDMGTCVECVLPHRSTKCRAQR